MPGYDEQFFSHHKKMMVSSSEKVVPLLIESFSPKSVIDVGCGEGIWLATFSKKGVSDIKGIDGGWVNKERLRIPEDKFMAHDLSKSMRMEAKYDLVLSLEVAEHIRKDSSDIFIDNLCRLSDIVVFSAAIPYQGGQNHVNEQWPDYWSRKFYRHGFHPFDIIRRKIWNDKLVSYWYKQNIVIYLNEQAIKKHPEFESFKVKPEELLSLVHPEQYLKKAQGYDKMASMIPSPLRKIGLRLLKGKG